MAEIILPPPPFPPAPQDHPTIILGVDEIILGMDEIILHPDLNLTSKRSYTHSRPSMLWRVVSANQQKQVPTLKGAPPNTSATCRFRFVTSFEFNYELD